MEISKPGMLAASIEIDLERYRRAGTVVRMPATMADLARVLGKVSEMLRQAETRGQTVDLGDEVVRLIQQFRSTLTTVGGAPAEA
jgi:type VI protein secretion system component VasF